MSAARPRRRLAEAPPSGSGHLDRTALVAVVLVVLAAAAVLLGGRGGVPGGLPGNPGNLTDNVSGNLPGNLSGARTAGQGRGVPVDDAVDGCPGFASPPRTRTTVVTAAAPVDGLGAGGSLRYGEPGDDLASAERRTPARGELVRVAPEGKASPPLAVKATGELAAGLFTSEVDTSRDGTTAATECPSPSSSWWFTGAGATLDHTSRLVISNLDPGPAVVDVRVLGPDGEIDTLGTRGITVRPESRTTIALTDVAPQGEELAVSVLASRGRVVAAMSDSYAPRLGANRGSEWIPAQASPARTLRLAGLPRKADGHALLVANPTEREALVDVEVSAQNGSFTPTRDGQVRVPPGSVVSTDLTGTLDRGASALRLRSAVPVTATVRSLAGRDTSYAASVPLITGPAAAPVLADARTSVQLSSERQPASADVTAYDGDGTPVDSTTVQVASGATASWSPKAAQADYLVVSPVRGRISGAVSFTGPGGVSQMSLQPLELRVEQPVVRPAFR